MTSRESGQIEKLRAELQKVREEVHGYHVDVLKHNERCKPCQAAVAELQLDMYGVKGETETHPGVRGHVESLRSSRAMIVLGLRGAWVVLTMLLGAAVSAALRGQL